LKLYKNWNVKRETDRRATPLMLPRETIDDFVNRLMDLYERAEHEHNPILERA
jgi:hypothetical protein